MARYDKYEPKAGGYRARLAEDFPVESTSTPLGVGHDADGLLVIGAGASSGITGVLILDRTTDEARREALSVLRPRIVLS